ncbi:L,D-transpeptidase family protein [Amycolatopsis australiensis]|uniref:L,D-peptidoglycan transpeptidase YkuD, ErfK/YbiS/YcfS/YnhG family n=1 Tax=Amycolatopsis australiensis TaxID=546364 RepID=A0A1K1RHE2_9PSEU|nr:L,D-transpeptidase family protein [Amycolatopsis australiensis]SFW71607.1 L,D-peptidoglycan transpeptidase YkuD, ErfK/YbiS/YcfS/YnhG family [Amycolatopsis australiensis]
MRRRPLGATLAAAALLSTAAAAPQPPSGPQQRLTVVAASPSATTAVLTAWQRDGSGWKQAYGPVRAFVGKDGIGRASESTAHTPAGVWPLTEAFGLEPATTRLPYRRVTTSDWWVSDVRSPYYNTHLSCAPGTCPFDEAAGEDLGKAGPVYAHAVVIDYNRDPVVPGAGSAFFLHVTDGRPTAGCVAVPKADLEAVLGWLDPAKHPVIEISG